jgi:hypothetical protein
MKFIGKRQRRRSERVPAGLIECCWCRADHVCAVDWEETDDTHWWIRLRCGSCGVWRDVVATDDEAATLDRALSWQMATIERALARFEQEPLDPSSFSV